MQEGQIPREIVAAGVSGPEGQARPGCAFIRGKRTAEPTLSSERWFLSGCYPKAHSRHLHKEQCKEMGLDVVDLETDQELQDLVLTVHHAFMHTFAHSPAIKIVENHLGIATVINITIQK
ncbi:MAG: hypothetical protein JO114_12850 [Planctomycetaceae bacterium]|nr:hypothetical protein [Planctomycetaceae bacterium]